MLAFPDLVLDLLRMRLGIVVFSGFLYGFDGLHVFPHREQYMRLPDVRLDWKTQMVNSPDASHRRV